MCRGVFAPQPSECVQSTLRVLRAPIAMHSFLAAHVFCKYLKLLEQVNRGKMRIAHKFVEGFLRPDVVFVIRLLSEKAGTRASLMSVD